MTAVHNIAGRGRRRATVAGSIPAAVVFACLLLIPSHGAAVEWDALWLNDDQRAAEKMAREDYAAAAETFSDQRWRAAALYRAGEYEEAARAWSALDDVDAHYNRGNALARSGELEAAVAAYETALQHDPEHADARHNLALIREMMQDSDEPRSEEEQADQESSDKQQQEENRQQAGQGEQEQPGQAGRQDDSDQDQSRADAGESNPRDGSRQQQANGNEDQVDRRAGQLESQEDESPDPEARKNMAATELPEQQAATEQWLRRIPDDPGGLLRRKFRYQYSQRRRGGEQVGQPW